MFDLRPLGYDHPDARALTARAQAYYVELYGGPDEDPLTATDLGPPDGGFLVGYLDDEPVAMGGWLLTDHSLGERTAQIRRMFVDARCRRRGLAGALLRGLEDDAVRHGATAAVLAAGQPQLEAIAFYRHQGYADIAPFGYYAGSSLVVCLGKQLARASADQPTS